MRSTEDRIEFLKEYLKNREKYLPIIDRVWKVVGAVGDDGAFNLGWDVGLLDENRPYLCEYWSEGVVYLTFFVSTKGIEDHTDEQIAAMIKDAGLVRYYNKEDENFYIDIIKRGENEEYYSINVYVGNDDGNFAEFDDERDYSILNDFNRHNSASGCMTNR